MSPVENRFSFTYHAPPEGVGIARKVRGALITIYPMIVFLGEVNKIWREDQTQETNVEGGDQLLQGQKRAAPENYYNVLLDKTKFPAFLGVVGVLRQTPLLRWLPTSFCRLQRAAETTATGMSILRCRPVPPWFNDFCGLRMQRPPSTVSAVWYSTARHVSRHGWTTKLATLDGWQ